MNELPLVHLTKGALDDRTRLVAETQCGQSLALEVQSVTCPDCRALITVRLRDKAAYKLEHQQQEHPQPGEVMP